jgi:adenylylsulfate kinase|tara:strand:+ start:1571 stop:2080 length:510 start_codon:yes stop_codon:yes gene_type:complete
MAFVLWMTGLPSSGKTTIIRKLAENIKNLAILDGDELREWLSPKNFSRKGRDEHNRRVAHIAKILLEHNVPVGVSLISPYLENRETAKKIINNNKKFFEVHVKCSLEKCEERDVKGLYKKARNNEIENFTGVNDPYEEPPNPDILIDTEKYTTEECVRKVLDFLKSKNL